LTALGEGVTGQRKWKKAVLVGCVTHTKNRVGVEGVEFSQGEVFVEASCAKERRGLPVEGLLDRQRVRTEVAWGSKNYTRQRGGGRGNGNLV